MNLGQCHLSELGARLPQANADAWPHPAGKGNAFASEFIPDDGLIGDASLEGERT